MRGNEQSQSRRGVWAFLSLRTCIFSDHKKNNQQKELYFESHPVDLRIRVRSVWMWERNHITHVNDAWEPSGSIEGSKRRHQRTRMNSEDVDTTVTSPKSINSIPEDYINVVLIKRSVLKASVLSPFISHIWGGSLIHNSGTKKDIRHIKEPAKQPARLTMSGRHPERAPSQGRTGTIGSCRTSSVSSGLKLLRPAAEPNSNALISPPRARAKRCHVSSCPAANNRLEDQKLWGRKAVTIMLWKKGWERRIIALGT